MAPPRKTPAEGSAPTLPSGDVRPPPSRPAGTPARTLIADTAPPPSALAWEDALPASVDNATLLGHVGPLPLGSTPRSFGSSVGPLVSSVEAVATPGDFATRYERQAVLGVGGMGEVLLCKDHHIGREVALKVIRDKASSESVMLRFLREARIQGQLEHPAIVPVYDLGIDPEGNTFFTMKRVRGATLDAIVHAQRKGDAQALSSHSRRKLLTALVSVCLAIDFAHRRGVVHRDLKPSNIILGSFGEVYVLDWGIAKATGMSDEPPVDSLKVPASEIEGTQMGQLVGTPGYMAPEQARGEIDEVDARSDVYALGAILFEILCSEPLHRSTVPREVLASTLVGPDARPSRRRAGVPPELDAICVRATAMAAKDRFPSARALSEAIERYLDGDRDGALRRDLAERHVQAAREAVETNPAGSASAPDSVKIALREVSSAIALDPGNTDALAVMADLLAKVPDEVPPEAEPELARTAHAKRREAARTGATRYALWLPFLGINLWMGIRHLPTLAFVGLCMAGSASLALWLSRQRTISDAQAGALLGLTSVTLASVSALFGPFILVPGLVATNTMFFALNAGATGRRAIIAAGALAVLVPFLLERAGLLPPSYRFTPGGFEVLARAAELPPTATMTYLGVTSVAMVIIPAVLAGHIRDALDRAERRVFLQAWHLRQLVPAEAQEVFSQRREGAGER